MIQVFFDPDPPGFLRQQLLDLSRPFHQADAVPGKKILFISDISHLIRICNPVNVKMVQRQTSVQVFLHNRKSGAAYRPFDPQTGGKPLRKHGFPNAQVAFQTVRLSRLRLLPHLFSKGKGLRLVKTLKYLHFVSHLSPYADPKDGKRAHLPGFLSGRPALYVLISVAWATTANIIAQPPKKRQPFFCRSQRRMAPAASKETVPMKSPAALFPFAAFR